MRSLGAVKQEIGLLLLTIFVTLSAILADWHVEFDVGQLFTVLGGCFLAILATVYCLGIWDDLSDLESPRIRIKRIRRSRLRCVERNGAITLIRTIGIDNKYEHEVNSWSIEDAESAISAMVVAQQEDEVERERASLAKDLAKRLNKGLR